MRRALVVALLLSSTLAAAGCLQSSTSFQKACPLPARDGGWFQAERREITGVSVSIGLARTPDDDPATRAIALAYSAYASSADLGAPFSRGILLPDGLVLLGPPLGPEPDHRADECVTIERSVRIDATGSGNLRGYAGFLAPDGTGRQHAATFLPLAWTLTEVSEADLPPDRDVEAEFEPFERGDSSVRLRVSSDRDTVFWIGLTATPPFALPGEPYHWSGSLLAGETRTFEAPIVVRNDTSGEWFEGDYVSAYLIFGPDVHPTSVEAYLELDVEDGVVVSSSTKKFGVSTADSGR